MVVQLSGEAGRVGRAEDVAVVQALLANIGNGGGRPFWDRPVDGRPSEALAGAIEAFQRRWVANAVAGGSVETGVVRPGSSTLAALSSQAPPVLDGLRAASTAPVILYAQDDPRGRAGRGRAEPANLPGATAPSLAAIQRAQGLLVERRRLAVTIGRSGLAGDRWGFRVALEGLTVVGPDGRSQSVGERPDALPPAIWRLVDGAFGGSFEVGGGGGLTGPGVYRSRRPLDLLRVRTVDDALLLRMEVPRPARYETAVLTSAALGAIAEARPLPREREDELRQAIAIVRGDDPATARLLEERWRALRNGIGVGNVRYASGEQLRELLKRSGEYPHLLETAQALAVVIQTIPDTAADALELAAAPVSALIVLSDILSGGAVSEAERLYRERLAAVAEGGRTVAGVTVPPAQDRRTHLLRAFGIAPAGLRLDDRREARLLDLMERILELQRTRNAGAKDMEEEIYRDWGGEDFLENLLRVYRSIRERITNPVNAEYRPDDQLARYALRVEATADLVTAARRLNIGRNLLRAIRNPRSRAEWGVFGDLLLEILQQQSDAAKERVRTGLARRSAAL
ncbi:MAG: peptidoglycan-binding domain-containing protein [Thalassobaculum sp.]|uniref:peptidoglycan-binding domain-containing protein n=1 Tax=Thalassobaculum sp. TaxID=2022740 RepID=UPI0032EAFAB6